MQTCVTTVGISSAFDLASKLLELVDTVPQTALDPDCAPLDLLVAHKSTCVLSCFLFYASNIAK